MRRGIEKPSGRTLARFYTRWSANMQTIPDPSNIFARVRMNLHHESEQAWTFGMTETHFAGMTAAPATLVFKTGLFQSKNGVLQPLNRALCDLPYFFSLTPRVSRLTPSYCLLTPAC